MDKNELKKLIKEVAQYLYNNKIWDPLSGEVFDHFKRVWNISDLDADEFKNRILPPATIDALERREKEELRLANMGGDEPQSQEKELPPTAQTALGALRDELPQQTNLDYGPKWKEETPADQTFLVKIYRWLYDNPLKYMWQIFFVIITICAGVIFLLPKRENLQRIAEIINTPVDKLVPPLYPANPQSLSDTLLSEGRKLLRTKHYQQASQVFKKADSVFANPSNEMGVALMLEQDPVGGAHILEAKMWFQRAASGRDYNRKLNYALFLIRNRSTDELNVSADWDARKLLSAISDSSDNKMLKTRAKVLIDSLNHLP